MTEITIPSIELSMNDSISARFFKASKALNDELRNLCPEFEPQQYGGSEPMMELNFSQTFYKSLSQAAENCTEPLIINLLSQCRSLHFGSDEIRACLIIFLRQQLRAKLSIGFGSISRLFEEESKENHSSLVELKQQQQIHSDQKQDQDKERELSPKKHRTDSPTLNPVGLEKFFVCVLTAIDIASNLPTQATPETHDKDGIMEKPQKAQKKSEESSPSSQLRKGESERLSETQLPLSFASGEVSSSSLTEKQSQINRVASSAVGNVVNFLNKGQNNGIELITVDELSEWYNAVGHSVAHWFEMINAEKWGLDPKIKGNEIHTIHSGNKPLQQMKTTIDIKQETKQSPKKNPTFDANFSNPDSRNIISFDFSFSRSKDEHSHPFSINISDENLRTLQHLVHRTHLSSMFPQEISQLFLRRATKGADAGAPIVLSKDDFRRSIQELLEKYPGANVSRDEKEQLITYCFNFFSCYQNGSLDMGSVDATELAIGFSLLCSGNKSCKLIAGFELLVDERGNKYLDGHRLTKYLRSYLTMLAGISLLSMDMDKKKHPREFQRTMSGALESGATWTVRHIESYHGKRKQYSFDNFAKWYGESGFKVAPWLELLDLRKLLSLLNDSSPAPPEDEVPIDAKGVASYGQAVTPRRRRTPGPYTSVAPADVLFTFPLAKDRSLVVLREDATYVRTVVEKLGLLSLSPDEVWESLFRKVKAKPPPPPQPWCRSRHRKNGKGKMMDVDQETFVRCMEETVEANPSDQMKVTASDTTVSVRQTLENFFQSFDLEQIDRVALNQLMGGLSLLCGGKKSTKLAFSFGLFDTRKEARSSGSKPPSLNAEDMFIFLRSFLIVMFSCCRQSLDLSADAVGLYISDTAHMVAEDVMKYQWQNRKKDRVDFDEFGEWYNEGGFETSPWLELLDLKKWVLVDQDSVNPGRGESTNDPNSSHYCPPPPPEDAVDPSFFGDDDHALIPMDSIDEMDILMLQNQPLHDTPFNQPVLPSTPKTPPGRHSNSLKFHLLSSEQNGGGYMLSVSHKRVCHLKRILVESGLDGINAEVACKKLLEKASSVAGKDGKKSLILQKKDFDTAIRSILGSGKQKDAMSRNTQEVLRSILSFIFNAFDRRKDGKPDALQVACGFTVLCRGKKSDKMEHGFEVLDTKKHGKMNSKEISYYLESFLTVLLCITSSNHLHADATEDSILFMNGHPCGQTYATLAQVASAGSEWAASQAFSACFSKMSHHNTLSFDEFAEWYTKKGYGCIPWLELLDLRKWALLNRGG